MMTALWALLFAVATIAVIGIVAGAFYVWACIHFIRWVLADRRDDEIEHCAADRGD